MRSSDVAQSTTLPASFPASVRLKSTFMRGFSISRFRSSSATMEQHAEQREASSGVLASSAQAVKTSRATRSDICVSPGFSGLQ